MKKQKKIKSSNWLLVAGVCLLSGTTIRAGLIQSTMQKQIDHLSEINSGLEEEYRISVDKISTAECREIILKGKIEGKIRRLAPGLRGQLASRLAESVIESSIEYRIDPDLILAIAHEESRFNSSAVSIVGAIGIMQVMPFWADQLEWVDRPSDLYVIEKNIKSGTYILSEYLRMFHGDRRLALLAYNRGPGSVITDMQSGNDPENGYSLLVLASYNRIRTY